MSELEQQESFVKESLFQFISKHAPSADLAVIDDIVLSYVISILEEAAQDPCFDVEGFVEMMTAYVPEFAFIDAQLVCAWAQRLDEALTRDERQHERELANFVNSVEDKMSLTLQSLSEMLPVTKNRSHSSSENSEGSEGGEARRSLLEADELTEQCSLLQEMFPNTCAMEIKHCVSIAQGDMERAAATLLHRRECEQQHAPHALPAAARQQPCGDGEMKDRIIARYSYVDKDAETREHRPLAPKIEPKKLVRYRDNKIVSLKGERYTEVPKAGVDEEHLKKPKRQHCP